MAQYEGFVTNWNGEKEYVNSKTWYSEIRDDLTLKQFKDDLRGNGYKFSDRYLVSCEKMAFANNLAEYFNVDLKEILKNYKLWSEGYKLWIDEDGFVHRELIIDEIESTEAEESASEDAAAETVESTEDIKESAAAEAEKKELIKKAAKENAKDCLYYGFGRKHWNSLGLDEETANEIWQQAIKELEK